MSTRPPIDGDAVSTGSRPYQRPLWARAVIWLGGTSAGLSLIGLVVGFAFWIGLELWGWGVAVVLAALLVGFAAGYWTARRLWIEEGAVPKL